VRAAIKLAYGLLAGLLLAVSAAGTADAQFFSDSVFKRQAAPAARPGFPAPPPPRGGGARFAQPPGAVRGQPQPARPQQAAVQPQQQPQRRCFFCSLFGGGSDKPSGWPFNAAPPVEVQKPKPAAPARPVRVKPAVEVTTFVTVLGDSIADHLGVGLAEAFEDRPEVGVRRRIRAASGLVRNEDYDWAKVAAEVATSEKLTYVVIELGSKDLVPFKEGDVEIAPLTEEWKRRYIERLDAVLAPFRDKKVKVFLVGLPPVKNEALSGDLVALNGILKERAQLAGATYVDVWEAFLDENNAYTQTGPDLEGQVVRLRLNDGVHFTRAGARKLAYYVEREIRRDLEGKGADPLILPGVASNEIGKVRPDAGPLIVLTAPVKAANGELAGATPAAAAPEEIARVLVRGEPLEPLPGRMDDLAWRPAPPAPEVPVAAPPAEAAPAPGAALVPTPLTPPAISAGASSRP
jgi:hypothetical protein